MAVMAASMAYQDRGQLGVVPTVDDVPQVEDVPEQPQRDGLISGNILQHGQVEVEADRFGVMQTQGPLPGHDGLSLQLDGGGDVESGSGIGFLVLGNHLRHAHPDDLVDRDRVLVVGKGDLGVYDLVGLLVHVDTLEHELQSKHHVSTTHGDAATLEDFFGNNGLAVEENWVSKGSFVSRKTPELTEGAVLLTTGNRVKMSEGSKVVERVLAAEALLFLTFLDLAAPSALSDWVRSSLELAKSYSRWSSWKAIRVANSRSNCGLRISSAK